MKRRILSIITALALCLSLCPTWAFAVEGEPDTGLCDHHPEHIGCGYAAPTEGHDCGHEHTEDCYTTDEAGGEVLDCHHSHNSECGYVQADPGAPCGYVCRICPIEDLIAALPEQVTEDNADDVRAQLDRILDLYRELNEDEQGQLDLSHVTKLQGALDAANAPVAAEEVTINNATVKTLIAEDGGCQGHTFTGTAQRAMIYVESGAHNVTFSGLTISESAKVGIAPGAAMNLTIEGTNTISATINCAGIYVPVDAALTIDGAGSLDVSGSGDGAGIGGAVYAPDESGSDGNPNCGTVEINGGTVTATGGSTAAGIGGGIDTEGNPGNGGNVTINSGTVTATGGRDQNGYFGGAGIGGGSGDTAGGSGGTLTINGGHVTLTAGNSTSYGFGQGTGSAPGGTCELTLTDASYLAEGTTLDPNGKYTINGDPTEDMIVVPELVYTGEVLDTSGIKIDDSKTGTGTYFGQTFTVNASAEGWVLQDLGEVVEAGEYTAVFKKGDKEISKTFTVAQSGTQFVGDGEVKTYNGETATDSFTAGDTITVKAMPTATGEAPQKAAARLRGGYTEPTTGQMAVFVGDTQVSEAVGAVDGSYTMEVSASEVLLAANGSGTGITLTARFTANDNMADGAGTVKVNITAVAKAERDNTVIGYYGESGLDAALADKNNEGAVFTLLDNMERETDLKINISCTLDLNGKTIRSKGEYVPTLSTYVGTAVTIRGEGTVISEQGHGFSVGGTTTLEGGTFISGAANCGGVYVQAGKLIVTGEAVVIENTGGGTGLGVGYNAEAQLSGGTYSSIWVDSPHTLAGLLNQEGASRVAYYEDNATLVTEGLDGKELTGTVTVKACTHTGEGVCTYTHNENTSTHTKTCLACGNTWAVEDCDYGEYTHNDTSHTRICKLCGYQNVEAHNIKCTAEASGTVIAVSEACKTCGYGKDLGTVTIHIPKLVYGDLTGVVTAENTLTEPVAVAGNVKNPLGETIIFSDHATIGPPTMATLTGNALLSAGEHKIKINIVIIRDENALAECELTFNVDPAPLPEVTLSAESATYSGTEQKPALSVQQGETALTEGTDYEVSYTRDGVVTNDFTNAGTVNITVTGKGNYTGSVEKTYTIGKATPTIAWANNVVTLTYTGQPADIKPVVTLVNGETFSGTITYHHTNTDSSESGESKAGLPTNAGIYGVGARIPEQDNYTAATTAFLMLTINKADQTVPAAPTAAEDNIKDNSITLDAIENAEYKRDDGEWQDSPVFTDLSPNTPYTFYVRLKEDSNHNASPDSTGASITTKKTMLNNATVTVSGSYTYTGAAIVPEAGNVEVVLNGTKIDSDQYTISASNNINAGVGKATLTVTATETGNYSGSVSSTFTIAPATLTIKANDQTITYGKSIATGTDQVTPGGLCTGDTLEGVTLSASSVNVPGGTITPSGAVIKRGSEDVTANYNITYQPGALTINKAQAAVTGNPTANTLTYTGAAQALVTAGTASVGEVVYSLTETGTYSTTIPTGTDAGSYTVWYKVEGTTNYDGTDPVKVDVTIAKVNYTGEKAGSTSGKFGMTKTYNLANLLPEGYKLGPITVTDANSIFEGTPTVSGTMLTYKLADSAEAGKTGTITIPVTESTNYNSFDLTITVTVTNVRIPDLNVNSISVVYTGNPVNSNQITGTATVDGNTVLGTWSFAEGQALTNVADSGPKSVVFNPTDTDEYGPATGTVTVTIRKATPSLTLTPSPATLPNGGTVTLTLSGLPGGSATVTCSDANITVTKGSGNTWTADLPAGGASYTFTASYSGDGNHNSASASCTVSVEKVTPRLSLTAAPAALRGSGTVTLTLSGLPAGGTATVSCSSGITVTAGAGSTWTATLPNSTATYTFTASYAGNASYHGASATCTVETTEVTVLPNPPEAEDGKQYQVVMEDGISEVPAGLQSIETLNTPEKLETAMKTAITQANSGVPQANTAVYDVELQISADGGATWTKATAANFPANGLTVTLPYPAGTNSSYTFTVVHMFTTSDFGKTPGDTETPRVTNTASGLQFTVSGLSPISVGWEQPKTPVTPPTPSGGGGGGGGGWSSSTYAVTVERAEHGKVTSNRTNASSGSTVTLTATPDSGYMLDTLTVTDSRGNEIRLTAQGGGKYTFTMPSRAVTVKAAFAPLPDDTEKLCDGGVDCPSHGFTDLGTVGTWYHEAVDYVLRNNLMGGYGNGLFGPNDTLTRAQFAQILYNKEGRPAVTGSSSFSDVAPGAWCAPAITWTTERGIVGGYGNGMFGPNDNITREQLAVMLWRYAGSPAATDKELHFNDADKASGYALDALRWAVENGVINGKGGGILDPKGLATRAQTAQILKNFMENR